MSKFLSRVTTLCAVIATMNLLLMAAIANDGSVGNSTLGNISTTSSSSSLVVSTVPLSVLTVGSSPASANLVRSQNYDNSFKGANSNTKDLRSSTFAANTTGPPLLGLQDPATTTSHFITANSTELKAQFKSNALLPCVVRNSGDGVTVSWIRRKDYHLITVGLQTYSSDERFQAIHAQSPEDWTLKIKYVQPRDAGVYECQVSTHPPSSIFVTLNVVEVQAEIAGGPDKYIKSGSTLELKCDLINGTEEPEYVFWYQGIKMINYDPSRHINVTHYKSSSILVLHNVQKSDSGNYSCVPSNAHPASIFVHILNGENPAAMQHGSHSTSCVPCPPLWFLSFLLSLTLQTIYFQFLSSNVGHYHYHVQMRQKSNTATVAKIEKHHHPAVREPLTERQTYLNGLASSLSPKIICQVNPLPSR